MSDEANALSAHAVLLMQTTRVIRTMRADYATKITVAANGFVSKRLRLQRGMPAASSSRRAAAAAP